MNVKQFISSSLLNGIDFGASKVPVIGKIASVPFRFVFPTMGYERVSISAMRPSILFPIFLIGFLICFVLQAYLAYAAGMHGVPDTNFGETNYEENWQLNRIMFFDDAHNLFNYILLVPLYLVAGTAYMISLFSLKQRMQLVVDDLEFQLDDNARPILSGIAAIGLFVLLVVLIHAGYAIDIKEKSLHLFWFHGETTLSRLNFNGHVYLAINMFLTGFVVLVAILHLELFRWSQILSHSIRNASLDPEQSENNPFTGNTNNLKRLLEPFTETVIWSKAFAMLLGINIFTWMESGVSGGKINCRDTVSKIFSNDEVSGLAQSNETSSCQNIITKAIDEAANFHGNAVNCAAVAMENVNNCGLVGNQYGNIGTIIESMQLTEVEDSSAFFRIIFILFLVIALWAASLPRYRVQLELFKLRQRQNIHDYFDIRMPWTIGWSAFIDFSLLTFFTVAIFKGNDYFNLTATLFDG